LLEFPRMDAPPASGSRVPFRDADGQGAIVFDPARVRQAGPSLFAAPSGNAAGAGRGAAWFVDGEHGPALLKHYRRGGWISRWVRRTYLWLGEARTRSLAEFRLLQRLRREGLPAPAPLAAAYWRKSIGYRAALLVERIAPAADFADLVRSKGEHAPWERVGAAIGRCHARGARHADLNAHNILLDGRGEPWLIDWDKGRMEPGPGAWCARAIDRLERSLRKDCQAVPASVLGAGMHRLRRAHDQAVAA
jgi:3-deoxy-D-manno-octulosonic acid kinase